MSLPLLQPAPPTHAGPVFDRLFGLRHVKEAIEKRVENGAPPVGTIRSVDTAYLIPDHEYLLYLEVLSLLPRSSLIFYACALRSKFCASLGSARSCFFRTRRFRLLYFSVLKHGLQCDEQDVLSIPWIFAAGQSVHRVHARHRACMARFLGVGSLPTLVITPQDLRAEEGLSDEERALLDGLPEPDLDLSRRPAGLPNWLVPGADNSGAAPA